MHRTTVAGEPPRATEAKSAVASIYRAMGDRMTTALVTGASGGIGLEIARVLAPDHDLVLVARSAAKLDALATELGGARVMAADLAELGGVAKIAAEVPDVDVLVNNAGVGDFGPFAEVDLDKTLRMIQLNITSLTALARHYLPGMLERGHGRVMNVASTASFQPGPLMAVYYATKAYVLSFTEAVAEETRGTGITVTALCPGSHRVGVPGGRPDGTLPARRQPEAPDRGRGRPLRREGHGQR